jgi:hypothetical protein
MMLQFDFFFVFVLNDEMYLSFLCDIFSFWQTMVREEAKGRVSTSVAMSRQEWNDPWP